MQNTKLLDRWVISEPIIYQPVEEVPVWADPQQTMKRWTGAIANVGAFTIPPDFKKVLDTVYPDGKTYNGPAEQVIAEFKLTPEQIPGTRWWAEKVMVDKMASEVEAQGSKMLTLKVYENTVPTLWTEYILVVEATKPSVPAVAVASPLAWNIIIIAALAIVGIIIFYFFFLHPVLEFIYKAPGAAAGVGFFILAAGVLAVIGIAASKGTSIKKAVTG